MRLWLFARKNNKDRKKPSEEDILRIHPTQVTAPSSDRTLLRDASLYGVFNFLSEVCLGAGWRFEGEDAETNTEILQAIVSAEGFEELLRSLLWAMVTRFALAEIIWDTSTRWVPAKYRMIPHSVAQLQINDRGDVEQISVVTTAGIQQLPSNRAILYRYRPTIEHPEGSSLLDSFREDISFKRRAEDTLMKNTERFGAPYIVLRYPPGMSDSQKRELLSQGMKLQSATIAALPEGIGVELIEPRGNIGQFAIDTVRFFERRIARGILGSILAMFESEFGTRAQAETHFQIIKYVVASRQADVESTISKQLVLPTLIYNGLPTQVVFKLNEPDLMDKESIARWVADLAQAGILDMETDRDLIRGLFGLD